MWDLSQPVAALVVRMVPFIAENNRRRPAWGRGSGLAQPTNPMTTKAAHGDDGG
jgi:hypothetical protein